MPISTTSGGIVTVGTPGAEAEQQAAEDEQDRVRDPQRARQDQQRRGRDQQREQLQLLPRAELENHRGSFSKRRGSPWCPTPRSILDTSPNCGGVGHRLGCRVSRYA